jgi:2,4-dienoyl-CoA reductase-like NADH-dependent reductase (Old Yellow Enzyme family)
MGRLFEKSEINGTVMQNRVVRSATFEGMADEEGYPTAGLTDLINDLACGGVGLIITGHTFVQKEGRATPFQLALDRDECVSPIKKMTDSVHRNGGKIFVQLSHAGAFARPCTERLTVLSVSETEGLSGVSCREMSAAEIVDIVCCFGSAARRAKEAGFDGIELHAAHGYLFSQFLSPAFNHRTDAYGGSTKNRVKALVETVREIRNSVGKDYPLVVKMNGKDYIEGGMHEGESVMIGKILAEEGTDGIEVSGGLLTSRTKGPSRRGIESEEQEAYFSREARMIKKETGLPVILVGGIRSMAVAERIVEEGAADFIAMSRPFIREPDLVNRWKNGDCRKSACTSDNLCFRPTLTGKGLFCVSKSRER